MHKKVKDFYFLHLEVVVVNISFKVSGFRVFLMISLFGGKVLVLNICPTFTPLNC